MLRLETIVEGFKLYLNDYLILNHGPKNIAFAVGIGKGKYKTRYGGWRIKEKLSECYKLKKFDIIKEANNKIIIHFTYSEILLKVTFIIIEKKLEIIPKLNISKFNRFWIHIAATKDEAIYGCGEQFSEFNLRGKKVPLWVEEQGNCRGDPWLITKVLNIIYLGGDWYTTYYPQPTFLSTNGYFCHVESSSYAEFNFKKNHNHELYIWQIPEKIIIGKYKNILTSLSELSRFLGRQPELPEWSYDGVWLGIQGGKEVVDIKLQKCLDRGVKVGGVWCQDWEGIRMRFKSKRLFWNWIYDDTLYPNLPSYIEDLNSKNIKFLGYINSFLATDGEIFRQAEEKGYCIKNKEGETYFIQTGNGETALVDLTNPDARTWLKSVIKKYMLDIGLSGWMADFGEFLPLDAKLHSGENPELVHNYYPTLWAQTIYEALEESKKLGQIVSFTRSGYSYTSRYTICVWAGDQLVDWSMEDGLASVIPAALSLGICGIGYHHSDIGGYSTFYKFKRTPELFMRWAEHSAFSMIMRTHEGNIPPRNIQFDDIRVIDHFALMSKIFVHLKSYKIALSKEYQETGIPPIRPCFLYNQLDPILQSLKYQYLFGRELLVAPVIKPNIKEWEVYLPKDTWIHLWTGRKFNEGWQTIPAPIGQPPVFYRKNSKNIELFEKIKQL